MEFCVLGSVDVIKAPMAPNVARKGNQLSPPAASGPVAPIPATPTSAPAPAPALAMSKGAIPPEALKMMQAMAKMQARALEQGVPYQTLIASVLHKYVTGHLADASRWGGRPDPCPHSQAAWPSGRLIPSKLTYLSPRATRTTDRTPWPRSALQTTKRSANSGCGLLRTQN